MFVAPQEENVKNDKTETEGSSSVDIEKLKKKLKNRKHVSASSITNTDNIPEEKLKKKLKKKSKETDDSDGTKVAKKRKQSKVTEGGEIVIKSKKKRNVSSG